MLYRQLPARSPIPRAAFSSLLTAFTHRRDLRPVLRSSLEKTFAARAMLCASGTHALQIALTAVKQTKGDQPILLPAYTCYEVATAAIGAGVRVALYDLDPDTLEPDWDSLRSAAENGAGGVVIAPLFGLPVDWTVAQSICRDLGAVLIEDAAQAHGSTWQQQPVGSLGDLSVLSFGRGKGWTGGGGGALLWRGDVGDQLMSSAHVDPQSTSSHREVTSAVASAAQWLFARPRIYALPAAIPFLHLGETIYHPPTPPRTMTRTAAALLVASKAAADAEVEHRRINAQVYGRSITRSTGPVRAVIGARADDNSGALRFPLRRRGGWAQLRNTPAPLLGAAPGYPKSLLELPALHASIAAGTALPGAELLARELVTLPTHRGVSGHERSRLIQIVTSE